MRRITYKKAAAVAMAAALSAALLVGCGSTAVSTDSAAASTVADESAAESTAEDAEKTADEGDADEVAAKNCADLIDAIYVQERSADTDAQCEAAKAAWDALTDTQKELVEGENADPDYFGRDTGDAGKDDPRNADDIGENELLVVSFGTSSTAAAPLTSRASRTPCRPPTRIGASAAPSPRRSSSTTFRPATARRSTTWIRRLSVPLPTASRIWLSSLRT